MSAATSCVVGAAALFAGTASSNAQGLIFDWGGEEKKADSGKQHAKFNGPGKAGDIIVSFTDRKLYFITAPGQADTYPIAIPREQSRWEGITTVSQKKENPSWTPTPHMLSENPKLPRWVPGGHPMNPLGNRALYLGSSDYRIHGTDAPWTIGSAASKGCVRMFNKDVADLYPRVKVGSKVTVTWQKMASLTSGATDASKAVIAADAADADKSAGTVAGVATPANEGIQPLRAASKTKSRGNETAAVTDAPAAAAPVSATTATVSSAVSDETPPPTKSRRAKAVDTESAPTLSPMPDLATNKTHSASIESKSVDATVDTPVAAPTPSVERQAKRKLRSKTKTDVETGSITPPAATPAAAKSGDAPASEAIILRALAAAERAADSAERAAAAAERAVAASEKNQSSAAAPTAAQ
jgi:hypothetical protein